MLNLAAISLMGRILGGLRYFYIGWECTHFELFLRDLNLKSDEKAEPLLIFSLM